MRKTDKLEIILDKQTTEGKMKLTINLELSSKKQAI